MNPEINQSNGERFHNFVTASEFSICNFTLYQKISFGCNTLNTLTHGGIQASGITEVAGESGCGKTQICLQLALMVQLPELSGGLDKGAVYICTEDSFPSQRLVELIHGITTKYSRFKDHNFMNSIFIQHLIDWDKFRVCMEVKMPQLLEKHKIGLIIVDSIAGIFRTSEADAVDRSYLMRQAAEQFLLLSRKYECAVVCTNQISSFEQNCETVTTPALGLAWSNLINTRLMITKCDTMSNSLTNSGRSNNVRRLDVKFCSYLPKNTAYFQITSDGIVDYYS